MFWMWKELCERISFMICNIVVSNEVYVLAPYRGLIVLLESRETAVSDRYREPREGPARGISEGPGRTPARMIML